MSLANIGQGSGNWPGDEVGRKARPLRRDLAIVGLPRLESTTERRTRVDLVRLRFTV